MASEHLTSTTAAELLNVGVSTIKRWADDGVVPCIRTVGGHRRFDRAALVAHAVTAHEQDASHGETARWMSALLAGGSIHAVIGALHMARHRHSAWTGVARELGWVLSELGRRWADGAITVLEEHAATERLNRGLTMVMASMPVEPTPRTVLLLTAEGEEHTMGLTLVELCAREAGWSSCWAGRNTPFADLDHALRAGSATLLAVSASAFGHDAGGLQRQCERLEEIAERHDVPLVLGGQGPWPEAPRYARRFHQFEAFVDLLSGQVSP